MDNIFPANLKVDNSFALKADKSICWQHSNFQAYREWLIKNKPDKKNIIQILEEDKDWVKLIASLRNAHEINHSEPKNDVQIVNFKLCPGNKFSTPGWKYDLGAKQGPVQDDFSDIVTDMSIYLSNLLTFFEEFLMCCIEDKSDKNYNFKVYKKIPKEVNKNCPTIYFVSQN